MEAQPAHILVLIRDWGCIPEYNWYTGDTYLSLDDPGAWAQEWYNFLSNKIYDSRELSSSSALKFESDGGRLGAAAGGGATDTANMQGAEPDAAGDGGETRAGVACPSSPSPSAPASKSQSQSQSQSRLVYSPTQGRRVTQSTIPERWSQASLTSRNEYQVATLNMELAATHRLILQNPLLKPRVRVSPRPLSLTLTPNSISPVHHRQQLRMNMSKPISCAASAEDNGSTTTTTTTTTATASPIGAVARIGEVKRVTKETNVSVKINLDGTGVAENNTGIPFLDHMLDQLASHGLFDVHVKATGDIHIDDHHTNEDVALAIGTACLQALGDRKGINRFGDFSAPLDEALIHVALDLSGRPYLGYDLQIPTQRVGTYDTQLVEHFFQSLVNNSGMTLHIRQLAGRNSHHIIEATFKAFARALRQATEYDPRRGGTVPSSKGVLSRC
nr:imidazoleglycerol-phosphate dehydratase [Quercus suber]